MSLSPTEIGYAEITDDATTTSTSYIDVAGLSVTVTVGTRPIVVVFDCAGIANTVANGGVGVAILEDDVQIGYTGSVINSAGALIPAGRKRRRSPSEGSHTYKIQFKAAYTGTVSLKADSGVAFGPASIQVLQV